MNIIWWTRCLNHVAGKKATSKTFIVVFNIFLFVNNLCHCCMARSKMSDNTSMIIFRLLSSKIGQSQTYTDFYSTHAECCIRGDVCTVHLLTICY